MAAPLPSPRPDARDANATEGSGGAPAPRPSPTPVPALASAGPPEPEADAPAGDRGPPRASPPAEETLLTLRAPLDGDFKAGKDALVRAYEHAYLRHLLARCGGNVARSAREAGLDRKHLYSLLHRHGLL